MDPPLSPSLHKVCNRCKKDLFHDQFHSPNGADFTRCASCRSKARTYIQGWNNTEAGKESNKKKSSKYQRSENRKITKKRHKGSARFAATDAAYDARRRELRAQEYERIHSDPGQHLQHAIGCKISHMLKGTRLNSSTVSFHTSFSDAADLQEHLSSLFEPWMSFENFGKHRIGGPRVWNIGHRIARFHYNPNDPEDVRRCWMRENLFPQDASENLSAKVSFPDESMLLSLRTSWPTSWNDCLPSQSEREGMERSVFRGGGSVAE